MDYNDETFTKKTLVLCGNHYRRCKFIKCLLVYDATDETTLEACDLLDGTQVGFDGFAGNLMVFFNNCYHNGLSRVVDDAFTNIRLGRFTDRSGGTSEGVH